METAASSLLTSIISNLFTPKAFDTLLSKIQEMKDTPGELKNLETEHIPAIRNSISKLDAILFDKDVRDIVENRVDELTLLCYDIQDMFGGIAREPSCLKKRASDIIKLRKKLEDISSQLTCLAKTKSRNGNGFDCEGEGTNASDQPVNCKKLIVETALSKEASLPLPVLSLTADKLAEKCGGFPEVAVMLGSILASRGKDDWNNIITTDVWDFPEFKEVFLTLRSRCSDMEPHLKQCLAYFSLFPCTYQHFIDELIQLWAAEGFISTTKDDCVKELLKRAMLELSPDSTNTVERPTFKLQKFNHELSKLAAASTFLRFEPGKEGNGVSSSSAPADITSYTNVRHLSVLCETIDARTWEKLRKSRLRTLIALSPATALLSHDLVKTLKRLRVLSLKQTSVKELPNSIDELQNLHYLDISNTPIIKLPENLPKITTLQFLRINGTNLSHLPNEFRKLTNLVCIDWDVTDIQYFGLPSYIGDLRHLQTLPLFPVYDKEGCSIVELRDMDNLQGSIWIRNLENITTKADAEAANLGSKVFLEELKLEWSEQIDFGATQEVLTGLKPHDILRKLTIKNGAFPNWLCDPKRMLETIHLKNCRVGSSVLALGELLILKTLIIEGVDDLLHIGSIFCGIFSPSAVRFQSLDSLTLKGLLKVRRWTELGPADMPKLRELKIISCPELIGLPSFEFLTSLEDLQIECCPQLESLPDVPTSLASLIIKDSTLLNGRCHDADGEDWEKVCNIAKVYIDDQIIFYPTVPEGQHQPIDIEDYQTTIQDNTPAPGSHRNNIVTLVRGLFSAAKDKVQSEGSHVS